jgi:hypothetical protein
MQIQKQLVNKKKALIKQLDDELVQVIGLKNKLSKAKKFYEHELKLVTESVEYNEESRVTYKNKMIKEALKNPREKIESLKELQYISHTQIYILKEKNELNSLIIQSEL